MYKSVFKLGFVHKTKLPTKKCTSLCIYFLWCTICDLSTDLYTLPEKVHFFPENFRFWNSLLVRTFVLLSTKASNQPDRAPCTALSKHVGIGLELMQPWFTWVTPYSQSHRSGGYDGRRLHAAQWIRGVESALDARVSWTSHRLKGFWPLEITCRALFYDGRRSQKCILEPYKLTSKFHSKILLTKPNFSVKFGC